MNQRLQSEAVALNTKSTDLSNSHRGNIGLMTEWLSPVNVADMHLHGRNIDSRNGVSNTYACMRVSTRIDYDTVVLTQSSLDTIYQDTFLI